MEQKKYEEIKTTIGFEMPLKKSDFAKDKASVYVSFTIGSDEVDTEKYQDIADKKALHLAERMAEILVKRGSNMLDSIVDERIEEIRQEYEKKLAKAKEMVKSKV